MSEQELERLDQLMTASEVRHGSGWYLLAEDGPAWHPVGGPYPSRGAARVAKIEAARRWRAIPHDARSACRRGTNLQGATKFQVRLYREVPVWQLHVVEVEAADEEDAERKAILIVEADDFDEERWEVVDCERTHPVLVPPNAVGIEPLPRA
ncbi:MAG: hypothetical protein U0790_00425 [Isosphaeraceae bacterium]